MAIELNGIANMHAIVNLWKLDKKITEEDYKEFTDQVFLAAEYLRAWEKDNTILWHKFKASFKPEKY